MARLLVVRRHEDGAGSGEGLGPDGSREQTHRLLDLVARGLQSD
jgi:hypothetical protein